jgi:hypothetical protein
MISLLELMQVDDPNEKGNDRISSMARSDNPIGPIEKCPPESIPNQRSSQAFIHSNHVDHWRQMPLEVGLLLLTFY